MGLRKLTELTEITRDLFHRTDVVRFSSLSERDAQEYHGMLKSQKGYTVKIDGPSTSNDPKGLSPLYAVIVRRRTRRVQNA